jgi:hypothetical protein
MHRSVHHFAQEEIFMLKVFVSTRSTQGDQPGDFCYAPTNELVGRYSMVCDSERSDGSGCGCGRSFSGFVTDKGTTTAMVVERDLTELAWRSQLFEALHSTGWADAMDADDLAEFIDDLVEHDFRAAAELTVGMVIGRRAWNDARGTVDQLTFRGLSEVDLGRLV